MATYRDVDNDADSPDAGTDAGETTMFSADVPDNQEKTSLPELAAWVRSIAELTELIVDNFSAGCPDSFREPIQRFLR